MYPFWALLLALWFPRLQKQDAILSLTITHVKQGKGSVYASVWANAETFFKKPMLSEVMKADQDSVQFIFRLTPGEYAISAYQDINDNKKLDQGLFGIPKEPVGFGNNFRPRFSAPQFRDCSLLIKNDMKMNIELH
jgi:uncharacterized protein (DUF2141 family)